jgi:hypothetical protein
MANAAEVEKRRLAEADLGPSPMPKASYDFWRGELSLVNPRPLQLDSEVADVVRAFRQRDASGRSAMRRAISMEEFYTLLAFSKRQAVFAIREQSADPIEIGLGAIAMIEADRTDFRDILGALSFLYHAAARLGLNPRVVFGAAALISEHETGRLIEGFAARKPEDLDLRGAWGYDEVVTEGGLGFIRWGFRKYDPTSDLKRVALDIAGLLEADDYQPNEPEVATEVPRYWLGGGASPFLDQTLGTVRAGASVSGRMRPGVSPAHASQQLTVFIAELGDPVAATRLLEIARTPRTGFAGLAIAVDRLFALVVARSFVQGVEAHETPESLTRFGPGLSRILRGASLQSPG